MSATYLGRGLLKSRPIEVAAYLSRGLFSRVSYMIHYSNLSNFEMHQFEIHDNNQNMHVTVNSNFQVQVTI